MEDAVLNVESKDLREWLSNPLTQRIFTGFRKYIENERKGLNDGATIHLDSVERTALQTANIVQFTKGIEFVLKVGDLIEPEEKDEEEIDE